MANAFHETRRLLVAFESAVNQLAVEIQNVSTVVETFKDIGPARYCRSAHIHLCGSAKLPQPPKLPKVVQREPG